MEGGNALYVLLCAGGREMGGGERGKRESTTRTCSHCRPFAVFHPLSSSVVDCTKEMCVPRARWIPEQFRQTSTPMLTDAHVGPRMSQSAQNLFPGRPLISLIVRDMVRRPV